MRRREFIALLGGAATGWPVVTRGQQGPMPIIGFLSSRSPGDSSEVVAAFRKGLRQMGFVEGQNTVIAFRWAEGHYERLAALASDLVDLRAATIFAAGGSPSALAAKGATSTIPIVFYTSGDAVERGLVANLNKPDGNLTGVSIHAGLEIWGKRLALLQETVPKLSSVGFVSSKRIWEDAGLMKPTRDAANQLRITLVGCTVLARTGISPLICGIAAGGSTKRTRR